ncbi:MAG TPA: amino acid permease [Bryobacteraceae bacterium]|jgi:APA family basic amino acid/polyamine antiporter
MPADLPRKLGLLDSLAIVIGVIIGGGIFLVPNLVARSLPSIPAILGIWIFAGAVSFLGGLACAELGAALPNTGGQYVFLREAYGPFMGFLCGWSSFTVARTAQISWLAVTLAIYVSYFVPLGAVASKVLGLAAIALFTWINYRGVSAGALAQKIFTSAKLAGLLLIIGSAFLLGGRAPVNEPAAAPPISLAAFGVALIACLLAFDGWVQLSFVAGEIRDPKRNVLRALGLGIACVITVYLLANLAYLHVMSVREISLTEHVGAAAMERVLGPAGGKLISFIILLSIVGTLNGCILTIPRIYFAQASDGLFFRRFAEVHPRYRTPAFAIVLQGVWASILLLSGGYDSLIDYAMFSIWLLYGFMVAAVIILRRKRPDLPRPYRMWGYPVTPLLFVVIAAGFVGNTLIARPGPSLIALALMLTGAPVYWIWTRAR